MKENFFADYKKFIVVPIDEEQVGKEEFDPLKYASYYILTLSLFNSRISTWREAQKFEIDIEKSIKRVLEDFNSRQRGHFHLQLLELERNSNYFVLALSSKEKIPSEDAEERIAYIIDKQVSNPFYVAENWYKLIGEKGRMARKLFCSSFREYTADAALNNDTVEMNKDKGYPRIQALSKRTGTASLIKAVIE